MRSDGRQESGEERDETRREEEKSVESIRFLMIAHSLAAAAAATAAAAAAAGLPLESRVPLLLLRLSSASRVRIIGQTDRRMDGWMDPLQMEWQTHEARDPGDTERQRK